MNDITKQTIILLVMLVLALLKIMDILFYTLEKIWN